MVSDSVGFSCCSAAADCTDNADCAVGAAASAGGGVCAYLGLLLCSHQHLCCNVMDDGLECAVSYFEEKVTGISRRQMYSGHRPDCNVCMCCC